MTPSPPRVRTSPKILRALVDRRRTVAMFEGVARRHPEIAELHPMGRRVWLVSDPALARQFLVDAGRSVTKGEGLRIAKMMLGDSLLTVDDPAVHKHNRRLIQPAFSNAKIADYAAVMVAAAQRTDERWTPGATVDMATEMAHLTLDVVGQTLLGADTEREAQEITEALDVVLRNFAIGFIPGGLRLLNSPLPKAVRIRAAIATIRNTVSRIVGAHAAGSNRQDDIVAALLAAREDGASLTEAQVSDETATLLLAGHETTAMALTWGWWLLDRNPDAAQRLREEARAVLGDRAAAYDDLAHLPYATAVVAETMRLYPPAWMIEREVREPISIGDYVAPVGTTLLASPWIIQRDPRWWGADAAVFRPERWLGADGGFDPAAPGAPRGAYFPFGAGTRICIGESFAWAEAALALATLAPKWAPLTEPDQTIATRAAVTLRPVAGIRMRLVPARDRALTPTPSR